ncbi:MAG: bifunctional precorrin-2 dehydrogenase/sirohydrochlorin ferrochelatase [Thermodesulfobacteriota bacterium]|nr:MAG: bifunctional precorrin-2 dehydrogenase/sirohydrochlorin ferrochelatase [Thermodesulfobacteriota bacterium]
MFVPPGGRSTFRVNFPPMNYYPVFLAIEKRPAMVIGGGGVAERKVAALLRAGAVVTVISPEVTEELKKLIDNKTVKHIKRSFRSGDLEGARLVISATGSKAVNEKIFEEAAALKIPVNVVDDPGLSTFISPSVVTRGDLTIAISTAGKCPALSKKIRKELERSFGPEYGAFMEIAGAVRKRLLKIKVKSDKKDRLINALLDSPLPRWIKEGDEAEINGFLNSLLGSGVTLGALGIELVKGPAGRGKRKAGRA